MINRFVFYHYRSLIIISRKKKYFRTQLHLAIAVDFSANLGINKLNVLDNDFDCAIKGIAGIIREYNSYVIDFILLFTNKLFCFYFNKKFVG